jgi:hypothetical protein
MQKELALRMSASGSEADIPSRQYEVRFAPRGGHSDHVDAITT